MNRKDIPLTQKKLTDDAFVFHVDHQLRDPAVAIAFGGLAGRFGGIPPFEFLNLISDIPAYKIFLRDPYGLWYHNGIPGIGNSIREVAHYLRGQCLLRGARRIVTIGNSAGGYAAILFGILIQADEVQAFSPQTRLLHLSDFPSENLNQLHQNTRAEKSFLDLRDVLLKEGSTSTKICISYAQYDPTDVRHALHLANLPNVRLFNYPWPRHNLVKMLKEYGLLKPLLFNAVTGNQTRLHLRIIKAKLLMRIRCLPDLFHHRRKERGV